MSFWDGQRWVSPATRVSTTRAGSRRRDWVATLAIIAVVGFATVPYVGASAAGPALQMSPSIGPSGTKVAVAGSGFPTKTTIQVTWDGAGAGMPTASTNARGTFKVNLTVPSGANGPHTIGAVDPGTSTGKLSKTSQLGALIAATVFTLSSAGAASASPTSTPTAAPTATPAPTVAPTPTPTPVPSSTPVVGADSFGITELYPSLTGGKDWVSTWNNGHARTFLSGGVDPDDAWASGHGSGTYSTDGNGVLAISGTSPRIYIHDPLLVDQWRNVEITMYFQRVSDSGAPDAGLEAVARSNHLHDTTDLCDTRGMVARFRYDGHIDFAKEISHPNWTAIQNKTVSGWNASTYNTWIGYKFVVHDRPDGTVKLENYIDTTNGLNGGTWVLVNSLIDTGSNFGVGATPCISGMNPALQLTAAADRLGSETHLPNISVYFRSTGVNTHGLLYKKGSVREIAAP